MLETTARPTFRPSRPATGIWSPPYRMLTIGLVLTVTGSAFEALAIAATLPATVADLGGLALYGWAFSAFMLTNLIGITIAGAEADRQGPARPFLAGVVLLALGLLVAGFAPTMEMVIAGRAIQGLGAGCISSVAYAAIGRAYPETARPQMLAVLSSAWIVPGLLGPALAGLIADWLGWRWVFLSLAPLPPLAALMALPALRRLNAQGDAPRDWGQIAMAVLLAGGAGMLIGGLSAASLPAAVALIGAGLAVGLPALRRLLPRQAPGAAPGLRAAVLTAGLVNMGFLGADAFIPLALTAVRGQTTAAAGLGLTAATLTWAAGAWLQARLAPRGSRRTLILIGLALIAVGTAGLALVLDNSVPVLVAPLAWGVAGLGMGLAFSTISLVVLEIAPAGQEGTTAAAMQLANVLGSALGAGLGGVLVGRVTGAGPGNGLLIHDLLMVGVIGLAMLVATRLPGRSR